MVRPGDHGALLASGPGVDAPDGRRHVEAGDLEPAEPGRPATGVGEVGVAEPVDDLPGDLTLINAHEHLIGDIAGRMCPVRVRIGATEAG